MNSVATSRGRVVEWVGTAIVIAAALRYWLWYFNRATNLLDEYGFQRATTNTAQGTATILKPRTIGAVFSAEF